MTWSYLEKPGRLDFVSETGGSDDSPVHDALRALLLKIKAELRPDHILIDSRAGLHDLGGLSMHGLAHVDVHRTVFMTYDALDRLGTYDVDKRDRLIRTLLSLWLSFANRYRGIRPKIFIREDLFEAGSRAFPDASKLASRSVSLEWRVEALYRLLIRMMASTSEEMRTWLHVDDGSCSAHGLWRGRMDAAGLAARDRPAVPKGPHRSPGR